MNFRSNFNCFVVMKNSCDAQSILHHLVSKSFRQTMDWFGYIIPVLCSILLVNGAEIGVEDYFSLIKPYFEFRNVKLLTHMGCFTLRTIEHLANNPKKPIQYFVSLLDEQQEIAVELADWDVQSRFINNITLNWTLIDTPRNTQQGFIIDLRCLRLSDVFNKVLNIMHLRTEGHLFNRTLFVGCAREIVPELQLLVGDVQ